jgi:hypothetical protein
VAGNIAEKEENAVGNLNGFPPVFLIPGAGEEGARQSPVPRSYNSQNIRILQASSKHPPSILHPFIKPGIVVAVCNDKDSFTIKTYDHGKEQE